MRKLRERCSNRMLIISRRLEENQNYRFSTYLTHLSYKLLPENEELLLKAATLELKKNRNKSAIKYLNKYLELYPNSTKALVLLGVVYRNENKYDQAIQIHLKCLELDNENASFHYSLGLDYEKAGNKRTAKRYLAKAIELDSAYAKPYFRLAFMYVLEKKYDVAVTLYLDGLSLTKGSPTEWINLALCYIRTSKNTAAEKVLKEALQKFPASSEVLLAFGTFYISQKKYKKVDEIIAQLEKLEENDLALSLALKKELDLYNYEKVDGLLGRVGKINRSADYWYMRAIVCANTGKDKEAVTFLRKAIILDEELKKTAKRDKHFVPIRELVEFKHVIYS